MQGHHVSVAQDIMIAEGFCETLQHDLKMDNANERFRQIVVISFHLTVLLQISFVLVVKKLHNLK